jgi:hypothetical protein
MGLTPGGYGLLAAALGAVAGSLVAERLARHAGQVRTLIAANLANGLLLLVPVLAPAVAAVGVTATASTSTSTDIQLFTGPTRSGL